MESATVVLYLLKKILEHFGFHIHKAEMLGLLQSKTISLNTQMDRKWTDFKKKGEARCGGACQHLGSRGGNVKASLVSIVSSWLG